MFTVSIDITEGILHVCGGDPQILWAMSILGVYSPRMWR